MKYSNILKFSGYISLIMLLFSPKVSGQNDDAKILAAAADSVKRSNVIDVAYGKQKIKTLTSAISTVDARDIEKSTVTTAGASLFGKLAGLHVGQPGGEPGYSSPWYYIRGIGTYDNQSSLVLVDGVERSLDQIPVEDIQAISVLKDAAALALYGVKGANGVILVTTKRGHIGKTKIVLNMEYGSQSPTRIPNFIGSADYARYINEARKNDNNGVANDRYTTDEIKLFEQGGNPLYPNVNWFNELLEESSPIWKIGTNFMGGNKYVKYFVSLNYLKNEGIYKHTNLNKDYSTNASYGKLNFRSNIDIAVNKNLTATLDVAGHLEDRSYPGATAGEIFGAMYTYQPHLFPMKNPDGTTGGNGVYTRSPYGLITSTGFSEQHDRNLQTRFKMDYKLDKFVKGLSMYATASFDNYVRYSDAKRKEFAVYGLSNDNDTLVYTQFGQETSLKDANSIGQFNRWYTEAGFEFQRTFGKNEITANALYQMGQYNNTEQFPYSQQGLAGRVHYAYDEKYLAELGLSYTGTENAPKGNRFGLFPTISLGWILSSEGFMKDVKQVNFLKFRGSYGLTGSDRTDYGRFLYTSAYRGGAGYMFSDANTSTGGLQEGILSNSEITWEKNYMTNIGFDAVVFKNLEISFDVFSNRRTDILSPSFYSIPEMSGLPSGYVNFGQVTNKGFDGTITWNDKIEKFAYFVSVNAGFARSKVDKIGEPSYPDAYRSRVGKSVAQYYGYEAIGFFKDQAEIDASPAQFAPLKPGDIKYKDQNGDGVIDANDETAIGKTWMPELTYGANLGFSYAGFDISAQLQGVANRSVYLSSTAVGPIGAINQLPDVMNNRWTPENANNAQYPRLTSENNTNNYRQNTVWLKSGDFLRLRMLELGYTFKHNSLNSIGMSGLRLFARGMNLFTADKVKYFDPEITTGYPMMRSVHIGLKADF